jgi:hypothetical protein
MTPAEVLQTPDNVVSVNPLGRGLAGGIVGGLLIAALEFAALRDSVPSSMLAQLTWLLRLSVQWSLGALPVGLAIGILERRSRSHPPSAQGYAIAIIVGAVAGAVVVTLYIQLVDPISQTSHGFEMEWPNIFLYALWQFVFWGSIGAILHASNLRQKRSAIALRVGELERLRSERRLAEAQLEALHAQIEPEFVLSTLGAGERLYERDPAAADRALDALIQFLREATPLLRQQGSTIGQECRLVHAYVRTLGTATGADSSDSVEVDERAESRPLAPGLLLKLAQDLLGAIPAGAGNACFEVRASSEGARTSIDVSIAGTDVDGSGLAASLDRIKHRVITSCGSRTTLEVLRDAPLKATLRLSLIDQPQPQGAET